MTQPPVCFLLYKGEFEITNAEISKLNRLRLASQLLGYPIAAVGLLSVLFPHLFGKEFSLDNLGKFSSIFFGGIFFASINFFNKGDLVSLKKKKMELEVFIHEYDQYAEKTAIEQQKISEECEKIIQKRKGL